MGPRGHLIFPWYVVNIAVNAIPTVIGNYTIPTEGSICEFPL